MDRTGIIVVSLCGALLVLWFFQTKKQEDRFQQQQAEFARTNVVSTPQTAASPTVIPATTTTSVQIFDTNAPENTIVISNADARYTFTSRGGGLKTVELLKYPETISARWKKENESSSNGVATLNARTSIPVLAILGDTNLVGDGNFTLTRTGDGVRAEKLLPDGLLLTKEFRLSSNYLVNASVDLKNTSDKPLALPAQEFVTGTATPMDVDDNGMYLGVTWFDGTNYVDNGTRYFNTNTTTLFGFMSRTPTPEFRAGSGNVVWASAHNQFFALLAMPKTPAQQIVARPVNLPPLEENSFTTGIGIQTALVYPAQTLSANSNVERQIVFFAGPKEYRTLARIGEDFQNHADQAMNFGTGYISFWGVGTFFAKLLLSSMNWLHDVFKVGYGWAIVLITILLRVVFWPLTAASTRSMKRMQALAPEVKALKEKYKDDPQKFTAKQMELWKKNKVSPMGGCLPMMVQMPVFFGFLAMIRCAIELRGAHFLWVADLTKPDTLFLIPGFNFPFNLLPLLMVGVMVWQAHMQPVSPGMDPSQQKMMRYMPLMMLLFLYNYSSGMALYMTVSTLLGILQMRLTKTIQPPATAVATTIPALTPQQKKKK
ncbi:MAG TPA: membrane protein insertase YidC [Dongiaceae bacterium]|jgi:YidC/Oxa1 family membrane protein insertase|nr:membrane protein insertase YidC [Dongiaceae bacterium]